MTMITHKKKLNLTLKFWISFLLYLKKNCKTTYLCEKYILFKKIKDGGGGTWDLITLPDDRMLKISCVNSGVTVCPESSDPQEKKILNIFASGNEVYTIY